MDPMAIVSSLNVKRMAPKGYRKSINGQKSPQVSHKKVKPPPPSTAAGPLIYGDVGERGKPQGGGGAGGGDNGRKGNESNGKGGKFAILFLYFVLFIMFCFCFPRLLMF